MAAVSAAAREAGISGDRVDDIRTAVAEACLNALEHGNGNRSDLPVEVHFSSEPGAFRVHVRDCGRGFLPAAYPQPRLEDQLEGMGPTRGWGLFLIRQLADRVEVHADDGGCRLAMSFGCEREDQGR